jgi:hypothetical protein
MSGLLPLVPMIRLGLRLLTRMIQLDILDEAIVHEHQCDEQVHEEAMALGQIRQDFSVDVHAGVGAHGVDSASLEALDGGIVFGVELGVLARIAAVGLRRRDEAEDAFVVVVVQRNVDADFH